MAILDKNWRGRFHNTASTNAQSVTATYLLVETASKIVGLDVAKETGGCCCLSDDDRSIKLFGKPWAARPPTVDAINPDWLTLELWTTAGEERMIFGGEDIAIWVRAGEIVEDWTGTEIVDVTTELGKWVKGWSRGFSLGDAGVLVRNEPDCCFGGIVCGGWRGFVVTACPSGWIISAKSNRVRAGFDWRLSDDDGNFMADSFCGRFNPATARATWVFCSGPDLLTTVLSIFVTLAVVTTGFCTVNTEVGAAISVIIRSDCARFFKTDKAVAAVVAAKDGARAGDVIAGGLPMPTTEEATLGMPLTSVLPEFYKTQQFISIH